jgi:hypothetical protein
MATLVIKKELCKRFRRKGFWILALFIIVLAVCGFKVSRRFKHLHKEIRDLKNYEFVSNDRFSAYERYNDRKVLSLETKISDMSTSRDNPQSLEKVWGIIITQRQEIKDLTAQLRTIQQNQANSQSNLQNTKMMEGIQTQMRALSDNLEQMRRENDLLKRQQLEMTQKYEKALSVVGRDDVDQDFKQATRKKLSELVNANYGHEQTFKDVKKSLDNCAKQASLIALEAYMDDKLSTSTPQNNQASSVGDNLPVLREVRQIKHDLAQLSEQNEETKVSLTKLAIDQKLNNQRVTALETQQQEDEKLKAGFNEASTLIEKTLQDNGLFNQKDLEKNLSEYLKAVEKLYSEAQVQIERTPEQNMDMGQGNFGRRHHRHHHHRRNMEPSRIHEGNFGQKQEAMKFTNVMNHQDLSKKTPEELIQLMDQLLA